MSVRRLVLTLVATLAGPGLAHAQQAFPPPDRPPEIGATRATGRIVVDGAIDEEDWTRTPLASRFVQAEPRQGEPAAERTDVRLVFDDEYLYVGVECHDSRGAADLRVRDLRRDFDDTTDDFFGVAIDGVGDGRSALVFRVNALGALRDQQTVDGGLADVDFDAIWFARTRRSPTGWSAEIAIPWSTLRYRLENQRWSINFQRVNRRLNESSGWSPWPRVMQPFRMDYAGRVTGLEPPPPGRNLRVQPYLVGDAARIGAGNAPTDGTIGVGADVKWAMTPASVLDFTLNPDFGQTDVDRQVVNLTRFSVFFPERRQFFLENRGVFFTGNGQRFEPFFSRRIGLDAQGDPLPIRAGGRLSVRAPAHALGLLAVSQGGEGNGAEFGVVRYVRNFASQNRLGGLVTMRHDRGGESNIVTGVDGFWRPTATSFVRGTLTASTTTGAGGEGLGGFIWVANDTNWGYVGYISELVTSAFDARSGFILRNDYVRISPAVTLDWRPRWRPAWVRRFQPGFTLEHFVNPSTAAVQEGFISIRPMNIQLENGGVLQYSVQPNWQRPSAAFRPLAGVSVAPGTYDYLRHTFTVQTDPSARLAGRLEGNFGGYFDGSLTTWRTLVQATPDPRIAVSVDYTLNRLSDVGRRGLRLDTHLLGFEARLAAHPRLQLVSFTQWNTSARQISANARLAWEYRPLAFFTIVYNERAAVDGLGVTAPAPVPSRQLLAKLTWQLQL